jgi:undecaprenyl-diphosphatase
MRRARRPGSHLKLSHALALGALHGPAELMPVSSSAHTTLVPWLLGWSYPRLDPELRKAFEVALHAGTAAALLVGLRDEVAEAARGLDRRRVTLIVGSFVPPAVVGYTLERPIERRLGTPPTIAAGLAAGAAAMWVADARSPTRWRSASRRRARSSRACRATGRRSPRRAPAASAARTPTRCPATSRCP